jgi:hypothetical protein
MSNAYGRWNVVSVSVIKLDIGSGYCDEWPCVAHALLHTSASALSSCICFCSVFMQGSFALSSSGDSILVYVQDSDSADIAFV